MLYAVARGAGVGQKMLRSRWARPFVACDLRVKSHLDLWLTCHPELKRSDKHMGVVLVEWLKGASSVRAYVPCLKDAVIHPNDAIAVMASVARGMAVAATRQPCVAERVQRDGKVRVPTAVVAPTRVCQAVQ
jgi:hypothetical protein